MHLHDNFLSAGNLSLVVDISQVPKAHDTHRWGGVSPGDPEAASGHPARQRFMVPETVSLRSKFRYNRWRSNLNAKKAPHF
jgi:hypothetical protein